MNTSFFFKGWMTNTSSARRKWRILLPLILFVLVVAGGYGASRYFGILDRPLKISQGQIIGEPLLIERADTDEKRSQGLSGRTDISEGYGMLFIFPEKGRHGFWMKGMFISIDIFWLKDDGTVLGILEEVSPATYPSVFYPAEPVHYVLETRAGHARALGIREGDTMPGIALPLGATE